MVSSLLADPNVISCQPDVVFLVQKLKNDRSRKLYGVYDEGKLVEWDGTLYTAVFSKSQEYWTREQVAQGLLLHATIGASMAKEFDDGVVYYGSIVNHRFDSNEDDDEEEEEEEKKETENDDDRAPGNEILFQIVYEDGDSEEMDETEVKEARALYEKCPPKSKRKASLGEESTPEMENEDCGRGKRRRRTVNYREDNNDDEDAMEDDDDEDRKPAARTTKRSTSAKKRAPKKKKDHDNEEEDEYMADPSSDKEDDDLLLVDDSDDDDDDLLVDDSDDDDIIEVKPKPKPKPSKKRSSSSSGGKRKKKNDDTGNGDDGRYDDEFQKKMEKDRKAFNPNNNPQKWPKDGAYCDPVGIDPTHGIVEGIIANQVRKVGGLLRMVKAAQQTSNGDSASLGELTYPIRLQTACSGTDAPSIALGIVQETLDKICVESSDKHNSHDFAYTHEMSCEIGKFST